MRNDQFSNGCKHTFLIGCHGDWLDEFQQSLGDGLIDAILVYLMALVNFLQ